jgi:hypothetical protein
MPLFLRALLASLLPRDCFFPTKSTLQSTSLWLLFVQPVGSKFGSGIFFLLDAHPGEKDAHLVPLKPPASGAAAGAGDEAPDAPAPEPFDWVIGQYY